MTALKTKMQSVIGQIQQQKAAENSLSDIIPDVHQWHKQFTIAELQKTKESVLETIENWLKKYGYTSLDNASASHAKAKLEMEINNLTANKKYSTWEVAKDSYKKMLVPVLDKYDYEQLNNKLASFKSFKTKSAEYKKLLAVMEKSISAKDKTIAQITSTELEKKMKELQTKQTNSLIEKEIKQVIKHLPKVTNQNTQTHHLQTGLSESERIAKIKELTGVKDNSVAKDMYDATFGFSWQWDYEIRQVQCGKYVQSRHGHTIEQICKKAIDIENFIAASPQWTGGITYRGMSLSPKEVDNLRISLKAGVGNMQGCSSWSTTESISRGFACCHLGEKSTEYGDIKDTKVLLKSTGHTSATSIKHLSNFPGEDEVLASKKCMYKYIKEYMENSYLVIEVEPSI